MKKVKVIGGGLAGCEAALQLAKRGIEVDLYEMRPQRQTPAHKTGGLSELVCSNSFKGMGISSAHGLFKHELRALDSKLMEAARLAKVDAGESLTVDRDVFSAEVQKLIEANPKINLIQGEVTKLDPEEHTIIATGPLSSDALADEIFSLIGTERLHFFDAIAPVVELDSINMKYAYYKNRWEKGKTKDFINCPMTKEVYEKVVGDLQEADQVEDKPFEKSELFEGCLPIEEMARRGLDTLRHGPMRPVGLMMEDGKIPYAVIQLRAENRQKNLYNLVGFQTRLKWGTQKEIFTQVPALRNANFVRLGAMHRNTFIDSPKVLDHHFRLKDTNIFFAGQVLGAEGYTEAVGTGLYTGMMMAAFIEGQDFPEFPEGCCLHALAHHISSPNEDFQPMNFNFGLLPYKEGLKKDAKKLFYANRAILAIEDWKHDYI